MTSGSLSSALLLPPSTCDQWAESMCLFVESSLRTLNAHFESGVTRASLSDVRRQLMTDIADYAMESGASLTHVEVAVDLLLLRACGTYAISPPGSRDRDFLLSVAGDLPRLAHSVSLGKDYVGQTSVFLRNAVSHAFHAETLKPLQELIRQRRLMGPVSSCLPQGQDLLELLRGDSHELAEIAPVLGRLLAGILFETSDACTFPAVCCLVERLESAPSDVLTEVLDVYGSFWQPWTNSEGRVTRVADCLTQSENAMRSWLWQDAAGSAVVNPQGHAVDGTDASEPSGRGRGSIVGVLVAEPNLLLEPGAELEEANKIQSLLDELRSVVRKADTVGRFGYHHVYAICRIHRPEDLELIASRLHRNASHRGSGADGHEVYIGGIAFPSAESFDSDHMLQMALLRLDVARRSDSGIDILACDDSQEQIRRYHVSHTDDRVPSSPHLHEGPGTGPQRRSR